MTRKQHLISSGGVWPGYVAAVAGLVQSLLFVSAIVATVVYLMGVIGQSKPVKTQTESRAPQKVASAKSMPSNAHQTKNNGEGKPQWANAPEYETPNGLRSLVIQFPANQIHLDPSTTRQVEQVVIQLKQSGATRWRLIGHEEGTEPISARQAFFRIQTIRNTLLTSGVKSEQIEQRILRGDAQMHPHTQVVLVPLTEPINKGP